MSDTTTNKEQGSEKKTLVLALVAGMSCNAILSWMTVSDVLFSIFPWIALILSVQSLYQEYLRKPLAEDVPLVGIACFFVGAFGHSAFLKAQHPEAGGNFFAIIVSLVLMTWIAKKMGYIGRN
ncbi:YijD family membrane protein [Vibrio maerlii]|uniref:YijD family membrane protein n=1 Tax=Vibrio maerlii TaxID=2231648 RepID=UPI000E3D8186|nr:YijD family membrane protein [Vibrio maerlii]